MKIYTLHCTLVKNGIVSFKNYFDAFIAMKALHFEPIHHYGIKSGLKFSGFSHFFIPLPMNLETIFLVSEIFSQITITSTIFELHRCAATHWKA